MYNTWGLSLKTKKVQPIIARLVIRKSQLGAISRLLQAIMTINMPFKYIVGIRMTKPIYADDFSVIYVLIKLN